MNEHLEPELLRTFLEALDAGGVMRAARRVGRTPSAVSLQMRRLQESVGRPLFHKVGRRLELTPTGEALAGWAKRLLTLNDEALAALREVNPPERIRIGAPQDIVERWLPPILARFAAAHPTVRLELVVDHSKVLGELLGQGRLDLGIRFGAADDSGGKRLGSSRIQLFAAPAFSWKPGQPLPLVLLEPPCVFRSALLQALDAAGVPWRVAVTPRCLRAVGIGLGGLGRHRTHVDRRSARCAGVALA